MAYYAIRCSNIINSYQWYDMSIWMNSRIERNAVIVEQEMRYIIETEREYSNEVFGNPLHAMRHHVT